MGCHTMRKGRSRICQPETDEKSEVLYQICTLMHDTLALQKSATAAARSAKSSSLASPQRLLRTKLCSRIWRRSSRAAHQQPTDIFGSAFAPASAGSVVSRLAVSVPMTGWHGPRRLRRSDAHGESISRLLVDAAPDDQCCCRGELCMLHHACSAPERTCGPDALSDPPSTHHVHTPRVRNVAGHHGRGGRIRASIDRAQCMIARLQNTASASHTRST